MSDINFPTCDLSPGYSAFSPPREPTSIQSSPPSLVTSSVHGRLLAFIRDFVVDGNTLVAFIRAHDEALRIVREDKIPCGCLVVSSSPAGLEARLSPPAITRYVPLRPLATTQASTTVDNQEGWDGELARMRGESPMIPRQHPDVKMERAGVPVTAPPSAPTGELDLTEDPFCDD